MVVSALQELANLTALLVVTTCGADGAACNHFDAQVWDSPAAFELKDCADMAEQLMQLGKQARCEVVPSVTRPDLDNQEDPDAEPAAFTVPGHNVRFVL